MFAWLKSGVCAVMYVAVSRSRAKTESVVIKVPISAVITVPISLLDHYASKFEEIQKFSFCVIIIGVTIAYYFLYINNECLACSFSFIELSQVDI